MGVCEVRAVAEFNPLHSGAVLELGGDGGRRSGLHVGRLRAEDLDGGVGEVDGRLAECPRLNSRNGAGDVDRGIPDHALAPQGEFNEGAGLGGALPHERPDGNGLSAIVSVEGDHDVS